MIGPFAIHLPNKLRILLIARLTVLVSQSLPAVRCSANYTQSFSLLSFPALEVARRNSRRSDQFLQSMYISFPPTLVTKMDSFWREMDILRADYATACGEAVRDLFEQLP